jgi:hypothetical protein
MHNAKGIHSLYHHLGEVDYRGLSWIIENYTNTFTLGYKKTPTEAGV